MGMWISAYENELENKEKNYCGGGAAVCLGILFLFKYYNFFSDVVCNALQIFAIQLHPMTLKLLLPVGISFYTFQALSYVIDIYYGKVQAEKNLGKYAAFVAFFPQLVAGPIERAENLLPQMNQEHFFNYDDAVYGLRQMLWGFFKKIVIADTLANYVDLVYDSVYAYQGASLLIASFFFAIQIYCDFSGYSDIAIGTARLFGVRLMTNFNSPYFSSSVHEFWQRWHISLSLWFRDYLYIPLGGNRKGHIRKYINTFIVFLVSGLWHGANGTFVLWGGVHGTLQILEDMFKLKTRKKIYCISVGCTFGAVVFCWIFFRANTVGDAFYVIQHMFDGITRPFTYIYDGIFAMALKKAELFRIGISMIVLFLFDWMSVRGMNPFIKVSRLPRLVRWGIYYFLGMIIGIYCFRNIGANQFVYFQF